MLLDLKRNSGLDLKLDTQTSKIIFGEGLTAPLPAVRDIRQIQEVLLDPDINNPKELYYMYRDVHRVDDKPLLEKNNLRYDVTVIKSDRLGREPMKTAGHYHPDDFGELYEVLEGIAFCLLQRPNPDDYRIIEDVILVEARAGQKIVIPPHYGHILINSGEGHLVTSNWVSSRFNSEYDLYKKAKGAAYFVVMSDLNRKADSVSKKLEFLKNPFFKELPPIRFVKPGSELDRFGLREGSPVYPIIIRDAKKLDFLNHPEGYDYSDIFQSA